MEQSTQRRTDTPNDIAPQRKRLKVVAAIAAALAVAVGVSAGAVGAISTSNSTIRSNEFAKSLRVDAGVYDLGVTATDGAKFGSTPTAGSVSFEMHPAGADPLSLEPGDLVTSSVVLPAGMAPGELPAPERTTTYLRTWAAAEQHGIWTVTSTLAAETAATVQLPSSEFAVTAAFPKIVGPEDLELRAEIGLPERLTSTHASDTTRVPVEWEVRSGVYDLAFTRGKSGGGEISFASLPTQAGENLHLRAGDSLVTSITLPAGVTAGALPAKSTVQGRTIEWESHARDAATIVTRTETISRDTQQIPSTRSAFDVVVAEQALSDGFTVSAAAELPGRFVSAQPTAELSVTGKIGPPPASKVAAGHGYSMATTTDGATFAWGAGQVGQLGSGTEKSSDVPVVTKSPDGRQFVQVVAGWDHSMAIADDGTLWGWGDNSFAQTGTGESFLVPVTTPKQVTAIDGNTQFQSVSAGWRHTVALSTTGQVYVWGDGNRGVLGNGSSAGYSERPMLMPGLPNKPFAAVEAGFDITFAVTEDGEVWGTGSNEYGFLGLGESVSGITRPRQIPMPTTDPVIQVSAASTTNNTHVLALTDSGKMIGWGVNASGESGVPVDGESSWVYFEPTELQQPENVRFTKLAAGDQFSLGLAESGQVYSWGGRALGNGRGGTSEVPVLVLIPSEERIVDIAAGDAHAFALSASGRLYGWGSGQGGRLGNTNYLEQRSPIVIKLVAPRAAGATDDRPAAQEETESLSEPGSEEILTDTEPDTAGSETVEDEATGPAIPGEEEDYAEAKPEEQTVRG